MIWVGIVIGLVIGTAFGIISGYIFPIVETWSQYVTAKLEAKKGPYVKVITETNTFVAKAELELEGKEEKTPAIGFDISQYVASNDDDIEDDPEECKK